MNTKNLYLVDACCPACLAAGKVDPKHSADFHHYPGGCSRADDYLRAAREGRVVQTDYSSKHVLVLSDDLRWVEADAGRWTAVVSGPDHSLYPGHVWDDRFGVVSPGDPRIAGGAIDTRPRAS
jgi:hypothetical protein